MIEVVYWGRLGNRLFQYAMGRLLAERKGVALKAQPIPGFPGTQEQVFGDCIEDNVLEVNHHVVSMDRLLAHQGKVVLNGWFQRYEYYRDHKEKIAGWLRTEPCDLGCRPGVDDLVMHVRLGDVVALPRWTSCYCVVPASWCTRVIERQLRNRLYIVTEDPTHRYLEAFSKYDPIMVSSDVLHDFCFLKASKRIILSVSTFAWWAAWFSEATEIYSPMAGLWNPLLRPDIALHVTDESRYRYPACHCASEAMMVKLIARWTRFRKSGFMMRRLARKLFPDRSSGI